jgi:transposase
MENTIVGIDLAKNSFYVHIADKHGRMIKQKKKLSRSGLIKFAAKLSPSTIAIEACGGSNHWARKFSELGHMVKMIAPQFVKPYVKADKTDARDAAAIAEASSRQHMNFVSIKTLAQQNTKLLHSIRNRLVGNKVQLTNEVRGILNEYGIIAAKGDSALKKKMIEMIDVAYEGCDWEEVSDFLRTKVQELYEELCELEKKIDQRDKEIQAHCKSDDTIRRLMKVPGIGPITASALVAHVGNAKTFTSGRQFAAYFGLVPREHSTGGKTRLLGISKRGDKQIRSLLIHGARALIAGVRYVKKEKYEDWMQERSRQLRWAHTLLEKKGMNKTAVALANKHARIAWAILAKDMDYDPQHKSVRLKKAA